MIEQFPAHVHRLSPVLTLQGAVAHCDMALGDSQVFEQRLTIHSLIVRPPAGGIDLGKPHFGMLRAPVISGAKVATGTSVQVRGTVRYRPNRFSGTIRASRDNALPPAGLPLALPTRNSACGDLNSRTAGCIQVVAGPKA